MITNNRKRTCSSQCSFAMWSVGLIACTTTGAIDSIKSEMVSHLLLIWYTKYDANISCPIKDLTAAVQVDYLSHCKQDEGCHDSFTQSLVSNEIRLLVVTRLPWTIPNQKHIRSDGS